MKKVISGFFFLAVSIYFAFAEQTTIKVLAIGNSFSEDAVENYLYNLGNTSGVTFVIGNAYIGGCSLQTHWNNAAGNLAAYSFRKIVNGMKTTEASKTLEYIISNEDWDYISFQQVSTHSGILSSYFPYLSNLVNYVKTKTTNSNVKFAMHQTWAYPQTSTKPEFKTNYGGNQMTMYNAIVNAVWTAADSVDINIVIPSGTAIQNGRSSHVNDAVAPNDNFNRDGSHLSNGLGRYTAACTWFETLTGISVVGNTYYPTSVSAYQKNIAQNAAHLANTVPKSVSDMQSYGVETQAPVRFPVSLKVIDKTKTRTNFGSTDQIVAGLSQFLKFQGLGTDNWYYPLFNMSGTTGSLLKNDTAWIWTATIQAPEGNHWWYPAAKGLSYQALNKRICYYGESNSLTFYVAGDGEVSGTTEVLIGNDPSPVMLRVIDKTKGVATNGTGELNEKNVFIEGGKPAVPDARVKTSLETEYIIDLAGENALNLFPEQGNPVEKCDTAWIWSATVFVRTGNYTWIPKLKYNGASLAPSFLQFNVNLDGEVSGLTDYVIPHSVAGLKNVNYGSAFHVSPRLFNTEILVCGAKEIIQIYSILGTKVLEQKTNSDVVINTSTFPKGIYMLLIDKKEICKVIKE